MVKLNSAQFILGREELKDFAALRVKTSILLNNLGSGSLRKAKCKKIILLNH